MKRNQPFNALPLLPPKCDLETKAILKKAILAHRELAELKGSSALIPNQSVLIQVIGLQEAKMSSEIENIVTTNDELYRAVDGNHSVDPQTKEVLRYKDALWHGYQALRQKKRLLNAVLFEEIVEIITGRDSNIRRLPGTCLKDGQGRVIYTPPEGEGEIRDLLTNLERYIYSQEKIDPLIKLAIMHYQFEAIHPFFDGNGRTGRIINLLYLIEERVLELPILYLSRFLISQKRQYYELLQGVTEKEEWEPWVVFILDAIIDTAQITRRRVVKIKNLIIETSELIKEKLPKIYSVELIEILFTHPYCKIAFLERAGIARRQTASIYLQKLEDLGILVGMQRGKEKYYMNVQFLDLLG